MKKVICFLLFVGILFANTSVKSQNIKKDIRQENTFPTWFDSVKLGIMVHYGLYSIPSWSGKEQYAEWFYKGSISEDTARINFQKRVYGDNFSYFDYTKLFKAELFDAHQWIDLFKRAGAYYIVFSSKHHDGFCLWDTKTTNKNSMQAPSHRDFLKELREECLSQGIRFGLYYSLMEWDNPIFRWTIDTVGIEKYVDKFLIPQFKELVDLYKPSLVFADGDWDFDYKTLRSNEMVSYLKKKVGENEVIVNNRWGKGNPYGFLTPEYSAGIKEIGRPWSECRSLARSFGLNRNASLEDYLSGEELIKHFVQLVSMGGGLMLNVAPSADGQIPLLQQERLLQLGSWLKTNGEAIYGSKPYKKQLYTEKKQANFNTNALNFNWVRNAPVKNCSEDNFQVYLENSYAPQEDETINFTLEADDVAEIFIYEKNNSIYMGKATKDSVLKFTIDFQKGKVYDFKIKYEEFDVDANLNFYAQKNNEKPQPFISNNNWNGIVSWLQVVACTTTNNDNLYFINFEKLENKLRLYLDEEPNKNMKIKLLGSSGNQLNWQYKKGRKSYKGNFIEIDLSELQEINLPKQRPYVFKLEGYLKK